MATSIQSQAFSLEPDELVITEPGKRPKGPTKEKKPKKKRKRLSSYKKLPDRYSFKHLAKVLTSGERAEMLRALDRLRGRARVLIELACFSKHAFLRQAAISHLSNDLDALVEIAKYCHYSDTREVAVDELSIDNSALVEVACSSLFKDTRLDAVSLIVDPKSLAEVASRSPKRDSRTAALERIHGDSTALKKVARESAYRKTRHEAVKRLASDTNALCSVVVDPGHPDVKKVAAVLLSEMVDELDDVGALVEVAKMSPCEDERYLAIGRLSYEPWALRRVIYEARYRDARSTALMLLSDSVSELDEPELLAEVAILSPYEDCRSIAVERLAGQSSALLSVATKSRFSDARDLALEKMKGDMETLKSVAKLSKYHGTRKKAHKLVSKPEAFETELSRILG